MVARCWSLFLLHSVAVMSGMVPFVVPGFGGAADARLWSNSGKIFSKGADGLYS
jgi:uncharacterized protein (DUF697 family)